jgi:hypothetical protein
VLDAQAAPSWDICLAYRFARPARQTYPTVAYITYVRRRESLNAGNPTEILTEQARAGSSGRS